MNNNPLKLIFKLNSNGECSSQLISIPYIPKFFNFLESNLNGEELSPTFEEKTEVILSFCNIIKENRTIIEFFSSNNNKSLYFYLFEIYLNQKSPDKLKSSIILLLNELRINIQTNKEIYAYLFNNLSLIYRGQLGEENFLNNLILLNTLLSDTENYQKPLNYIACNGQGKIIFDSDSSNRLEFGYCLTIILNFRINLNLDNKDTNLCNLLKLKINNNKGKSVKTLQIDLKTPGSLIVKDKIVKILPQNEWISLVINFVITDEGKLKLFFFVNGENKTKEENYEGIRLKNNSEINSIEFFDNFYGEITSIMLFSQTIEGTPGVQSNNFLLLFKQNTKGIWKRKIFEKFMHNISKLKSIDIKKNQEINIKTKLYNNGRNSLNRVLTMKEIENPKKLKEDLIFIFTPFNYIDTCPNIIEDCLGQYHSYFFGNIRNHKYTCYQKKINTVCSLTNLFPIAEMFLIHPNLLTEENLIIFLKIIENILNYRKYNIQSASSCQFFKVLGLFLEKYPKSLYTEKILDSFTNIGKTMFSNNSESACKTYFKHILLNEKILSKYKSNLQIKFWNYIKLFCESDRTQIEKFINMNRISLLLRFYDRKRYKEICCQEHLDMFKDKFCPNKKIMEPPLDKKLSYMKDVLDVIIFYQEPKHSFYLFKLLTLDLSPCLIKFIIKIFIKALSGHKNDKEWKIAFIKELINNKYENIIINSFIHSLPDVRIDILELMYLIHIKAINQKQREYIENHGMLLKPFLLPTKIFYYTQSQKDTSENNDEKKNMEHNIIIEENEELKENKKVEEKNYIKEEDKKDMDREKTDIIENDKDNIINEEIQGENNLNNKNEIGENENFDTIKKNIEGGECEKNNTINNTESEEKGELVIKDEIYKNYTNQLFSYFLLWALDIQINIPFTTIHLQKSYIKNINFFQHLFEINKKIKDLDFTNNLTNSLNCLMDLEQNCYKTFYNNKFFDSILDISFDCYMIKEKNIQEKKIYEEYYNKCKSIILKMYINTLSYLYNKKEIDKFPSKQLEIIFIWGDKMIINEIERVDQLLLFSFMDDILFELLTNFKVNYESEMEFNINDKNNDITTGYIFNNYIIFISKLYHYCFQYRLDTLIYKNGLSVIGDDNKNEVTLPALFVYSMRIDSSKGKKINETWIDYRYIYEIYHRIKFIWQNNNLYKKKEKEKEKKKTNNKFKKYEEILQNIILNKSKKNLYKKELIFLFYQLNDEKNIDTIVPIIRIIQIFMMCIISVYINKNDEKELLIWLKEFKRLLRFIIISSSNLIMRDQIEFYQKIQEYALYVITIGICFLRKCLFITSICKMEIEKILVNIIMFCLFIEKFQINYSISHKKKRIFGTTKFNRNDLSNCATSILFNKYILNQNEQVIFDLEYIEKILTEMHYYDKIRTLLNTPKSDLEIGLFKNKKIINLLNEKYFSLYSYKSIVDSRFNEINNLKEENINHNYSENILQLLPSYEKELAKYSNNSLEINLDKKNVYRKIKRNLFSWNRFWSEKSIFYDNENEIKNNNIIDDNDNEINNENKNNIINENKIIDIKETKKILKYKLLNHYTKSFMKPLLVPILDIEYYLPNFTGFNKEKLFNHKSQQIIDLDIDKILKLSESLNKTENLEFSKNGKDNNTQNNELIGEKDNEDNYLYTIYIKSNPQIAEKLLKISNNLDFGKEEEEYIEEKSLSSSENSKNKSKIYFLSCLVKTSHHIKGVCFIDENQLNFKVFLNQQTGKSMKGINLAFTENDEDYDSERKTCFGSYFMFHHKDKNLYKISIKYSDIKFIFRRRYYYKNSALEIFTTKNKSFYFNFKYENDREVVLENIVKKLKDYNKIVLDIKDTKDSFDNVIGYQHNNVEVDIRRSFFKKKDIGITKKIESWKKWKISNFEFLMWLNIYSNRSYDDISQYPIFPWTLINYEDPLKKEIEQNDINGNENINNKINEQTQLLDYSYRDLSSPIGMLEFDEVSESRKEHFIMIYEELKNQASEFEDKKPYFYGVNYSNPIYVCIFLLRIFPFTNISIELQGNQLDDPNRLFFSVKNTFIACTSLKSDVRELIPEFFYLPEMLMNMNDIKLGKIEDGTTINNVSTPCNNDPYKFIDTMKNILENNKVSSELQNWVDLIFGIKSRGKEAELAKNIFTESSYQENIDLNKIEDKNAYLRMVEFGLIPSQIMNKECPKRDIRKGKEITDLNSNLIIYKCKNDNIEIEENVENNITDDRFTNKKGNPIVKAQIFGNERIILFNGNNIIEKKLSYSVFDKSFYEEKIYSTSLGIFNYNRIKYYYSSDKRQDKCIVFCNQGKFLIIGGYYDGSIRIINLFLNKFQKLTPFRTEEPILAIELDEEEKYLFLGNTIGNIFVCQINYDNFDWKTIAINTDQLNEISHINVNNDLNLWLSASIDGFINIYTKPSLKLVRSIKSKAKRLEYAFLSTSSLPSIIVINEENKIRELYSYSINGKFLQYQKEDDILLSPIILKDLNFSEFLAYISKNNKSIIIRNLPFLGIQKIIKNIDNISSIFVNEDMKYLFAVGNEEEQIYVIKESNKNASSN